MSYSSFLHSFTVSSTPVTVDIDCRVNIQKRHPQVVYRSRTTRDNINIAYVKSVSTTPASNLFVSDRSTSLTNNRIPSKDEVIIDTTSAFTVNVENFLLTDEFTSATSTDSSTPLFHSHTLKYFNPGNSDWSSRSLVNIQFLNSSLTPINVSEYSLDTDLGRIYNNLENSYSTATEVLALYFIQYSVRIINGSSENVQTYRELLNNESVYQQATFSDLDDWGKLLTTSKAYLIQQTPGGSSFTVSLPTAKKYAWKETSLSRIRIQEPSAIDTSAPWYSRITNGQIITSQAYTPGYYSTYKYSIAEFDSQSYSPYPPYKLIAHQGAILVSDTILKVPRNVVNEPDNQLTVTVVKRNADDEVVAVYTTDTHLIGNIYSGSVAYEAGISSIDEVNGFIELSTKQSTSYTYAVDYFVEESEYEFTRVDFNPLNNQDILNKRVVLYLTPETGATGALTQSIYYLDVDSTGRITYCSQVVDNPSALDTGTARLLDEDFYTDGSPRHDFYYDADSTASGLLARSSGINADYLDEFSFIDKYTVESILLDGTVTSSGSISGAHLLNFEGNPHYLVLGDIFVGESQSPEGMLRYNARQQGGGIKEDYLSAALAKQGEVTWYWDIGVEKPYPAGGAFYVQIPKSLYTDYGGDYTPAQIQAIVERHMSAGGYAVIDPYGIDPVVTSLTTTSGTMTVGWPSYGTAQTYNVYHSVTNEDFTLASGMPLTDTVNNTYTLTGLKALTKYYVYVAAINSDGYDEAGPVVAGTTSSIT